MATCLSWLRLLYSSSVRAASVCFADVVAAVAEVPPPQVAAVLAILVRLSGVGG